MRIGFNFTLGGTLDTVKRLVAEKKIDYCELLIDNFLHVPPKELESAFECPVSFHIMFSKFLENDLECLESLAQRLRTYIEVLQPIYISDHIARFTHEGRQLYHLAEPEYYRDYEAMRPRIEWWQDQLEQRLFLENYPSIMDNGTDAPWFFERLVQQTGAGVLFDASNAICGKHNCGVPLNAWDPIIDSTHHFHVAGYTESILLPKILLDTHDRTLSPETLDFLKCYRKRFDQPQATMTYERDDNIDYEEIVSDLESLRRIFEEENHARTA
ncbi:MAG: methanobactin biosynthesis cassette protein MbnB [Methylothermaceae bacterium]|nr:methanobactin biosynthesis cassette protein MbnB [Methylothermaceae bacterium]